MLVHGQQVRLTPRETRILYTLTGKDPAGVRTREGLRQYARAYLTSGEQDAETLRQLKLILNRYLTAL